MTSTILQNTVHTSKTGRTYMIGADGVARPVKVIEVVDHRPLVTMTRERGISGLTPAPDAPKVLDADFITWVESIDTTEHWASAMTTINLMISVMESHGTPTGDIPEARALMVACLNVWVDRNFPGQTMPLRAIPVRTRADRLDALLADFA